VSSGSNKLILAAMIFAVSMTFIDQTIVALAAPSLQDDLGLSATGVQWIINGYLLSLSALFAFGGRLADIAGHRRMVLIGTVTFATASALCGATPTGDIAETWMIVFRVIQGAGAALMFPAALAIVVAAFPLNERGKAMAIFFGIAGGLTAVGPIAGGYLTEWTWRAIFWVNVPVAIIAVLLTLRAKPEDRRTPAPMDYRGAVLIALGMGLAVLGFQQSSVWGWGSVGTWACIVGGILFLVVFVVHERGLEHPLMRVRIFADRAFAADNAVLFLISIAFVPLFFFGSLYAQVALGDDASGAGLYLVTFFGGFAAGSQWGGRLLDSQGARAAVVPGLVVSTVGFALWAGHLDKLDFGDQWVFIVLAGIGIGLVLGPANTDAINRAPRTSYGEATGITQTVRNFGASLGLAVLGTVLILQNKANIESSLGALGVPKERADAIADSISQGSGPPPGSEGGGERVQQIMSSVQQDFASSTQVVFYAMAGVLAVAFVVAWIGMPRGKSEPAPDVDEPVASAA
jgi:EmrB/QacA subfamily drug resistance transporter